ncbi:DUF397 domain-containing protein [Streptomyces sp. XD-27]|uniref:DUF397 domain-containing protein n=1 Tax=Streptomyces sp. XD-27 TaxID=3062779 RepID=UPI0026F45C09|nr:DUF397 domain-containing protein [Streptomyces sp. XD-27]WKX71271.1 DUF397 domain-containing protein [Streptomyces sp. XD-27]
MAAVWRKSSFSGTGPDNNCVELSAADGLVRLREGDDPAVVLATTPTTLAAFLRAAKSGRFDGDS